MSTLSELLAAPSVENWKAIVEIGKEAKKPPGFLDRRPMCSDRWYDFTKQVTEGVKDWPPEIERACPAGWPGEFKTAVEHRVRETDTYGHYLAKICGHLDLRLSDGSQAVWLERRFTGGVIPVSTAQTVMRLLSAALAASSNAGMMSRVKQAVNLLAGGVRNVGKVGCADETGGLTIERAQTTLDDDGEHCAAPPSRHEYRLEVEIKVGDEEQRPEQVARMRSVRARGGCYVLARSVEDAVAQIKAFRDSR